MLTSSREPACLDEETLAALVSGGLGVGEIDGAEVHLARCAACREVLAAAAFAVGDGAGVAERDPENDSSEIPFDADLPSAGEIIAGKYEVSGLLGRGGMGVVLTARHVELGHRVAIKLLSSPHAGSPSRFLREAKVCAQLGGEHIARVFDVGRLPSGVPFFVMEQLDGENLASLIGHSRVPMSQAIAYMLQLCTALKDAHAAGVIHRDLKPSNLFITRSADGRSQLKVLDFGISKFVPGGGVDKSPSITQADLLLGSPHYMSPEQICASATLDARTDIWAVGVIAYELVTGNRPFRGSNIPSLAVSIVTAQPVAPSMLATGVPKSLDTVILRCMSKDPAERFDDVEALAAALRVCLFEIDAPSESRAPEPRARSRGRAFLVLGVGVMVGVWLTLQVVSRDEASVSSTFSELPQRAPPPPSPRLVARCDAPLPASQVHWLAPGTTTADDSQNLVTLAMLCDSEAEAGGAALRALGPSPGPHAQLVLVPPHPFYSIDLERADDTLRVNLRRIERAAVTLELQGPACSEVRRVRLRRAGSTADVATLEQPALGNGRCAGSLTLPIEAYAEPLSLLFEPSSYSAEPIRFDSDHTSTRVRKKAPAALTRAPADRCYPPEFCGR